MTELSSNAPLLTSLLKAVSRSFYITLRVLPRSVRSQIGLAYLLARATDTIADTEMVPLETRRKALQALRDRIVQGGDDSFRLPDLAGHQASPAERILLERLDEALRLLDATPAADQRSIRDVLDIITSGQLLDLDRFAAAGPQNIVALQTDEELDDYTYRVAGCVGEFWTTICRRHLFPHADLDDEFLMTNGVRFGQGLQLTNILRDLPRDLRAGRCYLPVDALAAVGLAPADLLIRANEVKFDSCYTGYLDKAEGNLAVGWEYTEALPRSSVRVRLACAWPLLFGIKTLQKLRVEPVLDPAHRVKISRRQVRSLIFRSLWSYPWPQGWSRLWIAAQSREQP